SLDLGLLQLRGVGLGGDQHRRATQLRHPEAAGPAVATMPRRGVTSRRRGGWPGDRGSAMVELVVVLPILLIVLFAFVELSRAWFTLQIAMMAAREGARAAAVAPLNFEATDGQARIDAVFTDYNISPTSR